MALVSITAEIAHIAGIPDQCVEPLYDGLLRVLSDGRTALLKNSSTLQSTKYVLEDCAQCATAVAGASDVLICDGDEWERSQNQILRNSIDILICYGNASNLALLPVEGKLGMACEYPGDKGGSFLKLVELEDKYAGAFALLNQRLPLARKLVLLVPRDGQEWAWHRIRGWNLRGNKIGKLISCCVEDFLALIGLGPDNRPQGCSLPINGYRSVLIKSEFDSPLPMRQVQLPDALQCVACRRCRDACPRKAIALVPDEVHDGRLYPFVDKLSCKSGCRHCESVCPVLHPLH